LEPILQIEKLTHTYGIGTPFCRNAVEDVDFEVYRGEILCLRGRSGSGKTTVTAAIMGMLPLCNAEAEGHLYYNNTIDLICAPETELRKLRWKEIALVPQSSMNAFNPVYTIRKTLREMMLLEDKHITYSFMTNAVAPGQMGAWEYVSDGLGSSHLATILEGLGRASYRHRVSREELLDDVRRHAESGRAHIIITPGAEDYTQRDIDRLANYSGAGVMWLKAEEVADV